MSNTDSDQEPCFDIAVVGLACRVPGADNYLKFWDNIFSAVESIKHFNNQELNDSALDIKEQAQGAFVPAAAIMNGVECFDHQFFSIGKQEAEIMDPQHRHFLELCYEALDSAGMIDNKMANRIGLFAGSGYNSYLQKNVLAHKRLLDELGWFYLRHTSNDKDFLATQVAYQLNLTGPCVNIQTACSTSLVATHYACQSLLTGECDAALAGGVTIEVPQSSGYVHKEGDILSKDGHCKPFSADSTGTVFGSGAGVVVLKRLDDALRDSDHVWAVIKGSAVTNDGRDKVGYFAPGVSGHAQAINNALEVSGTKASSIELIEAHGTGTYLGDAVEMQAFKQIFAKSPRRKTCAIGSVKSNIGHLDTAAGVISLIKAIGAVYHKKIPPTLYSEKENPELRLSDSKFYLPQTVKEWSSEKRRAAVSSLGVGGTNAHVIIEQPPVGEEDNRVPESVKYYPVRLSAKDSVSLQQYKNNLADYLESNSSIDIAKIAYTLTVTRELHPCQETIIASSIAGLKEKLAEPVQSKVFYKKERPTVLMFAGGGSQRKEFGSYLYANFDSYKQAFDQCARLVHELLGFDIRLAYSDQSFALSESDPELALPLLFAMQYSFFQLLKEFGIKYDYLLGHSMGEYTAACIAGVFSLKDTIRLIVKRAELFKKLPAGRMLSACLDLEKAKDYLTSEISIAAINGPELVAFSGSEQALSELKITLNSKDVENDWIRIEVAAHSHMLDSILEEFEDFVSTIKTNEPQVSIVSNVTARQLSAKEACSPAYWREHLRSTVLFHQGLKFCYQEGCRQFIEIGPGKVLSTLLRMADFEDVSTMALEDAAHRSEEQKFISFLNHYSAQNESFFIKELFDAKDRKIIPLPAYSFRRDYCWLDAKPSEQQLESRLSNRAEIWHSAWTFLGNIKNFKVAEAHNLMIVIVGQRSGLLSKLKKDLVEIGVRVHSLTTEEMVSTGDELAFGVDIDLLVYIPEVTGKRLSDQSKELYIDTSNFVRKGESLIYNSKNICFISTSAFSFGNDRIQSAERLVPAMSTVIGSEFGLRAFSVSFSEDQQNENLASAILMANQCQADTALLSNGKLFSLQSTTHSTPDTKVTSFEYIKEDSVCMITGAFGTLGQKLALQLATNNKVKLVLLGRGFAEVTSDLSKLPGRYHTFINKLIRLNSEFICVPFEASDSQIIQAAYKLAKDSFGRIDYFFHTAGVINDSLILDKNLDRARLVFDTKLKPLEEFISDKDIHLLKAGIIFSSVSSTKGLPGQSDYASANAIAEAFAEELQSQGLPFYAVQFGPFQDSGMAHRLLEAESVADFLIEDIEVTIIQCDSFVNQARLNISEQHWSLKEHIINSVGPVLPGTMAVSLVWEIIKKVYPTLKVDFKDLFFLNPIYSSGGDIELTVDLIQEGCNNKFKLYCSSIECVSGYFSLANNSAEISGKFDPNERVLSVATESETTLDQSSVVNFGPRWDCLRSVVLESGICRVEAVLPKIAANDSFSIHPALLDVCLLGILRHTSAQLDASMLYAPVLWEDFQIFGKLEKEVVCYTYVDNSIDNENEIVLDAVVLDKNGSIIIRARGLHLRGIRPERLLSAREVSQTDKTEVNKQALNEVLMNEGLNADEAFRLLSSIVQNPTCNLAISKTSPTEVHKLKMPNRVAASQSEVARLNDVEQALEKLENISRAIVLIRKQSFEGIVAYLSLSENAQLNSTVIRSALKETGIAESKIPVFYLEEDSNALDKAENGDFSSLVDPFNSDANYEAPQNGLEKEVARIWMELLGVSKVSRYDSFIDLGGHSLLALRFIQKVKKEKGVLLDAAGVIVQNIIQIAEELERLLPGEQKAKQSIDNLTNKSRAFGLVQSLKDKISR